MTHQQNKSGGDNPPPPPPKPAISTSKRSGSRGEDGGPGTHTVSGIL